MDYQGASILPPSLPLPWREGGKVEDHGILLDLSTQEKHIPIQVSVGGGTSLWLEVTLIFLQRRQFSSLEQLDDSEARAKLGLTHKS